MLLIFFLRTLGVIFLSQGCLKGCSCVSITTRPTQAVALLGETVSLPCHFSPPSIHPGLELTWTRRTPQVRYNVYHLKGGQQVTETQDPGYRGRARVNQSRLAEGDASLVLSNATLWDEGRYECFLFSEPDYDDVTIQLQLAAPYSTPSVWCESLPGEGPGRGGTLLQCRSSGGYPEGEIHWVLHNYTGLNSSKVVTKSQDDGGRFSLGISATWYPDGLDASRSAWITCSVHNPRVNQTESHIVACDISYTHSGQMSDPEHERRHHGVLAAVFLWVASVCVCLLTKAQPWRRFC